MRPSIRLGRIFGVEIGLHYSWFIIAALIVLSLSAQFHLVNPRWGVGLIWGMAAVTAVLFFVSIVAHELSHAAVATARGMQVRSITLFALGGVANVEREPSDAKSEFWMAIVGPLTSAAIGFLFLGIARASGWGAGLQNAGSPLWAVLVWLGYINIALAVFNMVPGYPLDGGRVLRSIVWGINHNIVRATRISATVGQFVAMAFIVFGLFRFFFGGAYGGLWLALIGWFLAEAAGASRTSVQLSATLEGVRVADIASPHYATVDANENLYTFTKDHLLRTGRRCFVVVQNGEEVGLITVDELKRIERQRWPFTTVGDAARPLNAYSVSPDSPVVHALEIMTSGDVAQLPVISNGRLVGLISRDQVLQFIQTKSELRAA